jgi:hypothetical protein
MSNFTPVRKTSPGRIAPGPQRGWVGGGFSRIMRKRRASSRAMFLWCALGVGTVTSPLAAADTAKASATLLPETGRLVIDVHGLPPAPAVFFSAHVDQTVQVGRAEILGEMRLKIRVVQGRPEMLTLGISGDGEIVEVAGKDLRDWAVRQGTGASAGKRFLDLRPLQSVAPVLLAGGSVASPSFELIVRSRVRKPAVPGATALLLLTPGDAVGFSSRVTVQPDASLDLRVTSAHGMTPLADSLQFFATGDARIEVRLAQRGAATADAELLNAQLVGKVSEPAASVDFRLRGQVRAQHAGARLRR